MAQNLQKSVTKIRGRPVYKAVRPVWNMRPWNNFIRTSARLVKQLCIKLVSKKSPKSADLTYSKFRLVHLRGTDRSCGLDSYSPDKLLAKLRLDFHIDLENDLLYLMTDMNSSSPLVKTLQSTFGSRICQSSDIAFFKQEPFASNAYLIFAAELEMQNICNGYVETFHDHSISNRNKLLGVLTPLYC